MCVEEHVAEVSEPRVIADRELEAWMTAGAAARWKGDHRVRVCVPIVSLLQRSEKQ